jgi:hypothetical protein
MHKDKLHLSLEGIGQIAKLADYSKDKRSQKRHIYRNICRQLKKEELIELDFNSEIEDLTIDP